MEKTFTLIYSQYITQKKLNSRLKNKLRRVYFRKSIAWDEFNKMTIIIPFKLWQEYNYLKRYLIKPIFVVPCRVTITLIYLTIVILFFILYKLIYLITYPFSKTLSISSSQIKIDGVSFIIPTWNKAQMVTDCVKKLSLILEKELPKIPKEIIIVNNGSTDKTVKLIEPITSSIPINLINLPKNLGFAPAINLGVNQSKYNYIYLLNNDMIPKPNFFSTIINFAQTKINTSSKFFGMSSQIFFFDKNKRREESGKTYIYPYFGIIRAAHIVNNYNLQNPSVTCYPGGGSSLLNKHIFQKLGGYDFKTYQPMYCEDLDLGFLAWKYDFPSYFVPQSHIIHHHRSSSTKITTDPSRFLFKNLLTFSLKNISHFSLFLNHILYFPIYSLIDRNHFNYMLNTIPSLPSIFAAKITLLKYKTKISDTKLFDFIKFELKNV